MDLWIRSQDRRRLIPKPNLYVVYSEESKRAYIGDTMIGHIAKYKTEERAIEVLDEIQNILQPKLQIVEPESYDIESLTKTMATNMTGKIETYLSNNLDHIVYEMPKE